MPAGNKHVTRIRQRLNDPIQGGAVNVIEQGLNIVQHRPPEDLRRAVKRLRGTQLRLHLAKWGLPLVSTDTHPPPLSQSQLKRPQ